MTSDKPIVGEIKEHKIGIWRVKCNLCAKAFDTSSADEAGLTLREHWISDHPTVFYEGGHYLGGGECIKS